MNRRHSLCLSVSLCVSLCLSVPRHSLARALLTHAVYVAFNIVLRIGGDNNGGRKLLHSANAR